jgi:nucleotide sugar dehydrogenase
MKIAIIGHGFVGKAVDYAFTHSRVEKVIIDPKYGNSIAELNDCDYAFVCVPTPMGVDGEIDSSIVETVVEYLQSNTEAVIVLKSTVTPNVIDRMEQNTPEEEISKLVYNPEFLTEKNAQEQFVNPPFHILGGSYGPVVASLYEDYSLCNPCPVHYMSAKEASFVKYGVNCFLATKVTFFNQLFDACEEEGDVNFNVISRAIGADPRIGTGHTKVPGYDGKRGFGGACFPKDTSAWVSAYPECTVLDEVIQSNNVYRSQYELDDREKEQHIRYGDDA